MGDVKSKHITACGKVIKERSLSLYTKTVSGRGEFVTFPSVFGPSSLAMHLLITQLQNNFKRGRCVGGQGGLGGYLMQHWPPTGFCINVSHSAGSLTVDGKVTRQREHYFWKKLSEGDLNFSLLTNCTPLGQTRLSAQIIATFPKTKTTKKGWQNGIWTSVCLPTAYLLAKPHFLHNHWVLGCNLFWYILWPN